MALGRDPDTVWRLGEILKSTNVIDAHNPVHGILTEYVRMGAG